VLVCRCGRHWIVRQSRPIISEIRAKKLSGGSAAREIPDTGAPTHLTASRGPFATLGETSRYFNHPETNNTHKPKSVPHSRWLSLCHLTSHPPPEQNWRASATLARPVTPFDAHRLETATAEVGAG
jgi:hypothetical protein